MGQKLRWGIIGAGAIAKAFTTGVKQGVSGQVVAVGSRDAQKAGKFAQEFGIERTHGSYEALLADADVQAVYVATPHPMHVHWVIAAAEAGKHVLCEKPMGVNHAQVTAMIEAAREHNVFLMEAFMYRCHPQTARLVELIRRGAIGQVCLIQATFGFKAGFNPTGRIYDPNLGGGGILDVGTYPVSMSRLIAGVACGKPFVDPVEVRGCGHLGETGVDEWAVASVRFPNDILAQLSTSVRLNQENVVRIFGSEGNIVVPNPWTADRQKGGTFKLIVNTKGNSEEVNLETDRTAFSYEVDVVAQAIAAGQTQAQAPAMTWADSLGNAETLDLWRRAIGLEYPVDTDTGYTGPLHGQPLKPRPKHNMLYGRIDGLDKPISRLIMGCDNKNHFADAAVIWDDWIERGGNAFDTAYGYGAHKEVIFGKWVRSRQIRDQVVLIAKGAHSPLCTPRDLTRQLLESIDHFGFEPDIYIMHRDNPEVPVEEFVDVLNEHVQAGRFRIFGGSNWSIERIEAANAYAKRTGKQGFSILNNNLSLARMVKPVWGGCISANDPQSLAWLEKSKMPVMSWSSQARGYFLGEDERMKLGERNFVCWDSPDNQQRRERAEKLAKELGVLPINIAAAWVLNQAFPTFPLVGPRTIHETITTLPSLDIKLTPEQVRWLNLAD